MKTKYLAISVLGLLLFVSAVAFKIADAKTTETYCMLVGTSNLLGNKVTIVVDYGQQQKLFSDNRLKDENGDVKKFASMIDALNYMNGQGWEFVNAYAIYNGNSTVYNWMLKKKIEPQQ